MTAEIEGYVGIVIEGFAERLRAARSSRGLTQVRLAELLGISPRVYNRWERGAATPKLDTIVRLAEILDVSLDELVGRRPLSQPTIVVRNHRLHELYRQIDQLSDEDQQALIVLLDSLLKRSKLQKVLTG